MPQWRFITNHGMVLLIVGRSQRITTREIANEVGITERSVLRIIKDLEESGYIERNKEGRKNVYALNHDRKLRHRIVGDIAVRDLVELAGLSEE